MSSLFPGRSRLTAVCLPLIFVLMCAGFAPASASAQTMQFIQVTSFTPSLSPVYVLTGDLNGDGKPDLVIVSNEGSGIPSNAYVLLGNGDGSFGSASRYPIGTVGNSLPGQPALADLRGNGDLDLIVPSEDSNVVNVLLGNGDGTFQPFVSYPTSFPSVTGVTVGDFNGDKKLDLGVADFETVHEGFAANLDVLLGTGDGTFEAPISTPLVPDEVTSSIVSGDFNPAGTLDVAVGTGAVGVLLGDGNGSFQPEVTYLVGPTAVQTLVTTDFNGDGILDLAATNGTQVGVLLGKGDGTFQAPTYLAVGNGAAGIVAADMNSDGNIDLVVATSSGFGVWLGNGTGMFSLGVAVPVTGATDFGSVAVAAFKTGGLPGVAVSTLTSVFVFLQGPLPVLSLAPAALSFAPETPGTTSSAQTISLTNSGNATLTVLGIGISGADATGFAQTNNCTSLAANASCKINVTFTPNAAGTQTATLNVTDNAPGNPQAVALSGTGSDFSLSVTSQTTITVTPGQAANYSVLVSGTTGFTQAVMLSCGGAPAQSTCTVNPSSVMPGSTANVAVVTTAASAALMPPTGGPSLDHPFGLWVVVSGTLGLALLLGIMPYRRKWRPQLLCGLTILCLLSVGVGMSACGGGSNGSSGGGGTPAGTYALTVTGSFTSGSTTLTHNTKLTLVVQ
jgi:FG-GAP-like repeat/Abnormal spindle-like microcephaly-assoc'd, ASPM-SPD-2-Hydin